MAKIQKVVIDMEQLDFFVLVVVEKCATTL
jgi:hypothetical protein